MRSLIAAFIATALSTLASPGWAASQSDYDDCNQTKDQDRRIAGCTRVIDDRKEPAGNRAKAHYGRGIGWYVKGDFDRALADLSEAIRLDPKFTAAYNDRGIVFQEKRDYARAISDTTRAMELRGKASYEDYLTRANSFRLSGNPSAALDDIKAAGSAYPDQQGPSYYYFLGWNLYLLGRYDEAIDAMTSAIAQRADYYWAYFRRGASYDKKGDRAKAREDLQKAAAHIEAEYWDDEAKAVFAQFGLQSPTGLPVNAQSLVGMYDLYNLKRFRTAGELPAPASRMVIAAGDGGTIQAGSPSDVVKPESVWKSVGKLQGRHGYYDWKFEDGKTGRTDFVVTADNDLIGHVQISDPARQAQFNWWYLAKRRP
ncbi:tetratricopeptide repeat protein [Bradyrhizobium sediminis]|uniref:Tetratricopeptide repeat protein n=1 Tax=Bradyrhizobium sediminis TaxID=2840469 RepID=A0A975NBI1_9BRAD|nr:tetratricopeptide repeat protein [Bradyrhizobium sediminis]QWG12048.1 tetratricopeptide repeat protein [Bradyrhizobium sediminis]